MVVQEMDKDRLFHQVMHPAHSGIQRLRGRRHLGIGFGKQSIPDLRGKIDLPWGARHNVCRYQAMPQHAQMFRLGAFSANGGLVQHLRNGSIGFRIPFCLHGELERFETMVLGEIGHKGTEGEWVGSGVGEHLVQRWAHLA